MEKTKPNFQIDYNNFKNSGEIQNFINKQLWVAGGTINSNANNPVTNTIKWGGQSRFLLGFNFFAQNITQHTVSIILNQETIDDSVPLIFLCPNGGGGNIKFQQYFERIRPLSGSDTLIFTFNSTIAEPINYGVYMTRDWNSYYVRT